MTITGIVCVKAIARIEVGLVFLHEDCVDVMRPNVSADSRLPVEILWPINATTHMLYLYFHNVNST